MFPPPSLPPYLPPSLQDLRQFWTMYPHTPDNSFLGFVVEPVTMTTTTKKNQGVLYGKEGGCGLWWVWSVRVYFAHALFHVNFNDTSLLSRSSLSAYYGYGKAGFLNTLGEMIELHSTFKVSCHLYTLCLCVCQCCCDVCAVCCCHC